MENTKAALFVPGSTGLKFLHDAMIDLMALKKPDAKMFQKKNEVRPFDDALGLEFFSEKNDTSLMVFSLNNKKRPNTLVFCRFFNFKVYDMVELLIQDNWKLLRDFKKLTFSVGLKPMFSFNGEFDTNPALAHVKSLFLDFFRGDETDLQDVAGLQHVISVSVGEIEDPNSPTLPLVHFRVYKLRTLKSGQKVPRVEVEEVGPRFDFKIGRRTPPAPEVEKAAMARPKQLHAKEKKNVTTDLTGDKLAQIHVGSQDLSKMQTRKMKGLNKRYDQVDEEEFDGEDFDLEPESKKQRLSK